MTDGPTTGDGPQIAAVVVAYRSASTIAACIRGCLLDPQVTRVVIVDNSNDPETRNIVEIADDRRLTYLNPGANLGFARGCNFGAIQTEEPWLAFVNPDVELMRPLSEIAQSAEPTMSAISARLCSGESGRINARPQTTLWRETKKAILGSQRGYSVFSGPEAGISRVEQVDGALLLVRRRTFDDVGRFDERFELYYDDVDLCDRLRARGAIGFIGEAYGTHVGGHSFARASRSAFVALRISRIRYLRKRYSDAAWLTPALSLLILTEFATRSLSRQAEGHRSRWAAMKMQWRELRSPGTVQVLS